jgi:hypothetical protein
MSLYFFRQLTDRDFEIPSLLDNRGFLRLYLAVFFDEFVQQHRVYRLVAYGVGLAFCVASY